VASELWMSPKIRAAQRHQRGETLAEYADAWLAKRRTSSGQPLKDRTREHYRALLDNRILHHTLTSPSKRTSRTRCLVRWCTRELSIPPEGHPASVTGASTASTLGKKVEDLPSELGRVARSSHLNLLVSGTRIQKLRRRRIQDTPESPDTPGRSSRVRRRR